MPIQGLFTPTEIERGKTAIAFIEKHYNTRIPAVQVAMEVGLNLGLVQQLVKLITGFTIHNYQTKLRMDRAKEDLSDFNLSIKFIAIKHGFGSSAHLDREFKKKMGLTPKNYRSRLITEYHQSQMQYGCR